MFTYEEIRARIADIGPAGKSEIIRYQEIPTLTNEFLLFLKPAVCRRLAEQGGSPLWGVITSSLEAYGVKIRGAMVTTGPVILETRAIRDHYGAINAVSEGGLNVLDNASVQHCKDLLGQSGGEVLGAHQFIERYSDFTPAGVTKLFTAAKAERVAPGAYGAIVDVGEERILLLNGFHPEQVAEFESREAVIMLFQATSTTPWARLRADFIGKTNPEVAAPGSLRRILLEQRGPLGIAEVSALRNGIHMSAGPIEGVAELGRFMLGELPVTRTSLGKAIAESHGEGYLQALVKNAGVVVNGERSTSYDFSEDLDAIDLMSMVTRGEVAVDLDPE